MKKRMKIEVSLVLALAVAMLTCIVIGIAQIMINGIGSIQSIFALFMLIVMLTSAFYYLLGAIEE